MKKKSLRYKYKDSAKLISREMYYSYVKEFLPDFLTSKRNNCQSKGKYTVCSKKFYRDITKRHFLLRYRHIIITTIDSTTILVEAVFFLSYARRLIEPMCVTCTKIMYFFASTLTATFQHTNLRAVFEHQTFSFMKFFMSVP